MAFGSFGSSTSVVPGFDLSTSGSDALGGIDRERFAAESALAGQAYTAKAQLKGQEALARAQQYAADKQFEAATNPLNVIGGIVGSAIGGFGSGFGAGAAKKWLS